MVPPGAGYPASFCSLEIWLLHMMREGSDLQAARKCVEGRLLPSGRLRPLRLAAEHRWPRCVQQRFPRGICTSVPVCDGFLSLGNIRLPVQPLGDVRRDGARCFWITGFPGSMTEGAAPCAGGNFASSHGVIAMKSKELNAARRLITKVLASPRISQGQRDGLRKAKRRMDKIASSGKLDSRHVFGLTKMIAEILLDALNCDEAIR